MFGCHPSLNHYLSRRNRWSWTYACIAITKGINTLALTRSGPKSVKSFLGLSPKKALPQGIHEQNRKECKRGRSRARQAGRAYPPLVFPTPHCGKAGNSSPASMTGVSLHRFYDEIFDKIVDVANKRIDKQQLADWLSSVTIKISSS